MSKVPIESERRGECLSCELIHPGGECPWGKMCTPEGGSLPPTEAYREETNEKAKRKIIITILQNLLVFIGVKQKVSVEAVSVVSNGNSHRVLELNLIEGDEDETKPVEPPLADEEVELQVQNRRIIVDLGQPSSVDLFETNRLPETELKGHIRELFTVPDIYAFIDTLDKVIASYVKVGDQPVTIITYADKTDMRGVQQLVKDPDYDHFSGSQGFEQFSMERCKDLKAQLVALLPNVVGLSEAGMASQPILVKRLTLNALLLKVKLYDLAFDLEESGPKLKATLEKVITDEDRKKLPLQEVIFDLWVKLINQGPDYKKIKTIVDSQQN